MTNEKAHNILENYAFYLKDGTKYMKPEQEQQFRQAYEMAIAALEAQKVGKWIPVENGLPKPGEMVLVSCLAKNGRSSVNRAYMDENCFWHGSGSMSGVVAWQKLPEPYSEE